MSKFIKVIDNKNVIKSLGNIVIHKDGKQIINPTKEMILEDGWVEYVEPEVEVDNEISELQHAKWEMIENINTYDKSENVEIFYLGDMTLWLSRDERETLQRRFDVEKKSGLNTTTLWKNNIAFSFDVDVAIAMLDRLELYAIQSFDNTQRHLAAVSVMETVEEIKNYDYTAGYPEVLRF